MGTPYAGSNAFPVDFTIPDDGDPENASSVNVALEALGDRTTFNKLALADYLANHSPRMRVIEFLTSGTYVPAADSRIVAAWAVGCGGGGAGGNGAIGPNTADIWLAGAGGGGGAELGVMAVTIVPGETYNIDIGAGGATASLAEETGGNGGDTIFRHGATALAKFPGAAGGTGPIGGHALVNINTYAMGGLSVAGNPELVFGDPTQCPRFDITDTFWVAGGTVTIRMPLQLGQGGYGADGSAHPAASAGAKNRTGGFAGGAAAVRGADSSTQRGGGGGGGGGAGPFGAGAAGGNGGPHGGAADGGSAGAANSGAGGGGGGTGGYNSSTGQGYGGTGGSGRCRLVIVQESP